MAFIGKQPGKAAITSTDITDGIITAAKLASDSVTTAKIADNGVTTAKINADAVTDAKIADDVVGTEHLTAGEVDTTALGADAVTAAKIADNAISEEHLDPTIITGLTALAEAPADTDEFLLSDAGTLKKIDYSYIKGTSDFVKLASGEVTSSTSQVDIEDYFSSTYENYKLVLNCVHPATASGINLRLKLSGSYATANYYWVWNGINSIQDHSTTENYNAYYNNDRFYVSAHMDTNQDRSGHSIIDIFQPYKTERHTYIQFRSIGTTTAANNQMTFAAGGGFQMTDLGACTGVRVFMSSGNIETMDYQLYGIKK